MNMNSWIPLLVVPTNSWVPVRSALISALLTTHCVFLVAGSSFITGAADQTHWQGRITYWYFTSKMFRIFCFVPLYFEEWIKWDDLHFSKVKKTPATWCSSASSATSSATWWSCMARYGMTVGEQERLFIQIISKNPGFDWTPGTFVKNTSHSQRRQRSRARLTQLLSGIWLAATVV